MNILQPSLQSEANLSSKTLQNYIKAQLDDSVNDISKPIPASFDRHLKRKAKRASMKENFNVPEPKSATVRNKKNQLSVEMNRLLDLSNQNLKSFDDAYKSIIELCFDQRDIGRPPFTFTHLDISSNQFATLFKNQLFIRELKRLKDVRAADKDGQAEYPQANIVLLENVTHLNALNNFEIENLQDFIDQINGLFPRLKDLHISLSQEEDVSYIIDQISQLEMLNGIKVERDQIFQENTEGDNPDHSLHPSSLRSEENPMLLVQDPQPIPYKFEQKSNDHPDGNPHQLVDQEQLLAQASRYAKRVLGVDSQKDETYDYQNPYKRYHPTQTGISLTRQQNLSKISESAEENLTSNQMSRNEDVPNIRDINDHSCPEDDALQTIGLITLKHPIDIDQRQLSEIMEEERPETETDQLNHGLSFAPNKSTSRQVPKKQSASNEAPSQKQKESGDMLSSSFDSKAGETQLDQLLSVGHYSKKQATQADSSVESIENNQKPRDYLKELKGIGSGLASQSPSRQGQTKSKSSHNFKPQQIKSVENHDQRDKTGKQGLIQKKKSSTALNQSQQQRQVSNQSSQLLEFSKEHTEIPKDHSKMQNSTENSINLSEFSKENLDYQNRPESFSEIASILNIDQPLLKPADLEELAAVFDKIREMHKRRDNFVPFSQMGKFDELAVQFDQRLTEIMLKLSKVLKDELVSSSQKQAEIEKSKFLLQMFCMDTVIKFLKQSKFDLNQKDMKEVSWMLQKLREGVTTCFLNLGSLFYSKDEREVQNNCNSIVTQIKDKLKLQRGHSLKLEDKLKDLAENHSKEADDLRKKLENAEGEVENLKNQILEVSHKKNYFSKLCDKQIEDLKEVRKHFNQSKTHNEELVNDLAVAGQKIGQMEQSIGVCEDQIQKFKHRIGLQDQVNERLEEQLRQCKGDCDKLKQDRSEKDNQIIQLSSLVAHLKAELEEKNQSNETLTEENKKYLDLIIKYSYGGEVSEKFKKKVAKKIENQMEDSVQSQSRSKSNKSNRGKTRDQQSTSPDRGGKKRDNSRSLNNSYSKKSNTRSISNMDGASTQKIDTTESPIKEKREVTKDLMMIEINHSENVQVPNLSPLRKKNVNTDIQNKMTPQELDGHQISMEHCQPSPDKEQHDYDEIINNIPVHTQMEAIPDQNEEGVQETTERMVDGNGFTFDRNDQINLQLMPQGQRVVISSGDFQMLSSPQLNMYYTQPVQYEGRSTTKKSSKSRRNTCSPPTTSGRHITTKILNCPILGNTIISSNPNLLSVSNKSIRSKSTPVTQSKNNFNFVGGQFGELPNRIQGTSLNPVAQIKAAQSSQVLNFMRQQLKEETVLPNLNLSIQQTSNSPAELTAKQGQQNSQEFVPNALNDSLQPKSKKKMSQLKKKQYLSCNSKQSQVKPITQFTLRQMKELIADIYIQKEKHDDRCVKQLKKNRETMEQFLHTYFSQKFGLTRIVVEQIKALVTAISQFQTLDQEVMLFGKVIRHEVDEEFRFVQLTVSSTINQLVKSYLRQKYPGMQIIEMNKLLDDTVAGKSLLSFNIWSRIIDHMYDQRDSAVLKKNLIQVANLSANLKSQAGNNAHSKSLGHNLEKRTENRSRGRERRRGNSYKLETLSASQREGTKMIGSRLKHRHLSVNTGHNSSVNQIPKISLPDLQQTVLEFQLFEHEKLTKNFMEQFRLVDEDADGILSEVQFIDLMKNLCYQKNYPLNEAAETNLNIEIDGFLDILDPEQTDKIPLSDIVQLLSKKKQDLIFPQQEQSLILNGDLGEFGEDQAIINTQSDLDKQNQLVGGEGFIPQNHDFSKLTEPARIRGDIVDQSMSHESLAMHLKTFNEKTETTIADGHAGEVYQGKGVRRGESVEEVRLNEDIRRLERELQLRQ